MEPSDPSNFSAVDPDSEEVSKMLESLAAASAELEFLVQRLSEQLSRLGGRLRKTLLNEIRISRQRVDAFLSSYLTSASRDKEELITQLTQFRQSEIRSIMEAGKIGRQQVREQAERIFKDYSARIHAELDEIRHIISAANLDADVRTDQSRVQTLAKECVERVNEQLHNFSKRLPDLAREKMAIVDVDVVQAQSVVEDVLEEQLSRLRSELDLISAASGAQLEKCSAAQQLKFSGTLKLLDHIEKNLPQRFFLHWKGDEVNEYFEEVAQSFETSINSVSDLQSGSFQARLRNIALQSKMDILNNSRNASEEMRALQQEFIAWMAEQQRSSWTRCDNLLHKLEQAIELQVDADSGISERVKSALRSVSQEFRGKTLQKSNQVELYFERAIDNMIKNVENFGEDSCESLEQEYTQARRDYGALYEEIEKQLAELQKETMKIEKAGLGVSRIVAAYKKSNINFQPEIPE
ncbi:MAG: hypothetical protein K2X27_15285 [Candidatus Obscuribacterales bacterium]|nr:hypothetical protein [Candidatus Obscuribacterales bacterium]